jgi:hypothetical protein
MFKAVGGIGLVLLLCLFANSFVILWSHRKWAAVGLMVSIVTFILALFAPGYVMARRQHSEGGLNHAVQRTAAPCLVCDRSASWPPSLVLGP